MTNIDPIHIIGGGLAGSEAAWQVANAGVPVILHEMRPIVKTDAHQGEGLAELVCSNSFRSDDAENNAVGLLHAEMRTLNSIIMASGDKHKLPAGGALAVDRDHFSDEVTRTLEAHPLITIERGEVETLPDESWDNVIIATGPLTSESAASVEKTALHFLMPSPRLFTKTALILTKSGCSPATIKSAPAAPVPITSTARWMKLNITALLMPF